VQFFNIILLQICYNNLSTLILLYIISYYLYIFLSSYLHRDVKKTIINTLFLLERTNIFNVQSIIINLIKK